MTWLIGSRDYVDHCRTIVMNRPVDANIYAKETTLPKAIENIQGEGARSQVRALMQRLRRLLGLPVEHEPTLG